MKREKQTERTVYILLVIALAVYGFWNSEAAAMLIAAVKEAFSILIQ
jgi:hypothetical protein